MTRFLGLCALIAGAVALGIIASRGPSGATSGASPCCGDAPVAFALEAPIPDEKGGSSSDAENVATPPRKKYPEPDPEMGHIEGVVLLKGAPPKLDPFAGVPENNRDHAVCSKHVRDERLLIGKKGEVANAVVAIAGDAKLPRPKRGTYKLDNKGCLFVPHVLALPVGSTLEVHNSDEFLHNTRAVLAMSFNRAIPGGGSFEDRARKPGLAIVQCDFHPWMKAEVHVLPHEFFDVTGADGSFKILNLPPGTYTVEVRHEVLAPFFVPKKPVQTVTVEKGKTTKLGFEVEAPKL